MIKQLIIIADTDAIIAQISPEDLHHKQVESLAKLLTKLQALIIFPATTVAEAATTLQRKYSNPLLAAAVLDTFADPKMIVENVDQEIIREAKKLFDPDTSKHNTFFDCIVAAVAKKHHADAIFSFDGWYTKLGFKLVSDLF